jgi:hypothetical protein
MDDGAHDHIGRLQRIHSFWLPCRVGLSHSGRSCRRYARHLLRSSLTPPLVISAKNFSSVRSEPGDHRFLEHPRPNVHFPFPLARINLVQINSIDLPSGMHNLTERIVDVSDNSWARWGTIEYTNMGRGFESSDAQTAKAEQTPCRVPEHFATRSYYVPGVFVSIAAKICIGSSSRTRHSRSTVSPCGMNLFPSIAMIVAR